MSELDLARWQFGITTVYHFIFVPLTLGLSLLVAGMQTAWMVKKDPDYLRMTKFFGTLFLINFAVGVVHQVIVAGIPVMRDDYWCGRPNGRDDTSHVAPGGTVAREATRGGAGCAGPERPVKRARVKLEP